MVPANCSFHFHCQGQSLLVLILDVNFIHVQYSVNILSLNLEYRRDSATVVKEMFN